MNENEFFFCPSCSSEVPVVFRAATGQLCIRCHNREVEQRLRRVRTEGLDEIRQKPKPSIHDD